MLRTRYLVVMRVAQVEIFFDIVGDYLLFRETKQADDLMIRRRRAGAEFTRSRRNFCLVVLSLTRLIYFIVDHRVHNLVE